MTTYHITIFRQSRVLLMLFSFPFALFGSLFIAAEISNMFVAVLLIALFFLSAFYFTVGYLIVVRYENHIEFVWKKKFLFNYKDINPVQSDSIHTLVIEKGMLLRKIKTDHQDIPINNMKFLQNDIHKLIYALMNINKTKKVRTIDNWEDWKEKGYLKIAYRINTGVLLFAFIAVAVQVVFNGFDSRQLLFMLILIPQMFFYQLEMKGRLE